MAETEVLSTTVIDIENKTLKYNDSVSYAGTDVKVYAIMSNVNSVMQEYKDQVKSLQDLADESSDIDNGVEITNFAEEADKLKKAWDNLTVSRTIIELDEIQTLSYSVYRDKEAVRSLGYTAARGFTRGNVTIAGTMIFTVMKDRILHELFDYALAYESAEAVDSKLYRIDQLPPLDILVVFENELGNMSRLGIYGVDFMNEGQVHSVNDLITENSVNYLARHVSPMRSVTSTELINSINNNGINSSKLTVEDYNTAIEQIKQDRLRFM